MRYRIALAIGVAAIVAAPAAAKPAQAAVHQDARFAAFADRMVGQLLRLDPVGATQLGDHRFDALLPDVSPAGRAARRAFAERSLAELGRFDRAKLSREQQVDDVALGAGADVLTRQRRIERQP